MSTHGIEADYATLIQRAWQAQLPLAELVERSEQYSAAGRHSLAIVLYQTWLARNETPRNHFIWFNLGVLRFEAGDPVGAREAYANAIERAPDFLQARFNLGLMLERLGRHDDAVAQWQEIEARADANDAEARAVLILALNNRGRLQEARRLYGDALDSLNRSLLLDPEQPDALHHWIFVRARQCLWPVLAPFGKVRPELLRESVSVLAMVSLADDPEAQLAAALNYTARKIPADLPQLAPTTAYRHDRLRIGYCSSDFRRHPVAMLTVELFELHDRERFEIFAYCWSPEDGSTLRERIKTGAEHFIPIGHLDDAQAAALIRSHEIDILIDLQGQTADARPQLIARRPAPVQITYLGLPATTGLPAIDYVIADRYLIPEAYARFYSEKPLYMPDVYQVSDRQRQSAPRPTRRRCGLPAKGFVFCAFNNNYKITPEMFATWLRILERVPGSVLWLLSDNPWAEDNLRREATARGVDPARLVFNPRAEPEVYLARYGQADLFLDTYPFNGGTTANDALFMGVPVLTLSGRSFASRMAGALLTAAGLPELITQNLEDYEERAVALAGDARARKAIRQKLAAAKESGPLFDTPKFTRNLEAAYTRVIAEWEAEAATRPAARTDDAPLAARPDRLAGIIRTVGQAEQKQAQGKLADAIHIYRQWLKCSKAPDNWIVHFNLGLLLRESGDLTGARKALETALEQRPDFLMAREALAAITAG